MGRSHSRFVVALPFSPRLREGSTHLDLAVGHITRREERVEEGTLKPRGAFNCVIRHRKPGWPSVKWVVFSDLSTRVTHDLERTQLLRVIDNAIAFQSMNEEGDPRYVDTPVVTLVSPRRLWKGGQRSRLYHFLYRTYQSENGHQTLLEDLLNSVMSLDFCPIESRRNGVIHRMTWSSGLNRSNCGTLVSMNRTNKCRKQL